MITFRYHAVSIVAVFLALAVGVVLGSGPLHAESTETRPKSDQAAAVSRAKAKALQKELSFSDSYTTETAGRVVADQLTDRAVTIVTLPGADGQVVTDLTDLVDQAGGSVTARVVVEEKLLDVANRQLVAELATQMQPTADVPVPAGGTGYERIGALLAHAVTVKEAGGVALDEAGKTVLAGLDTAGLVTTDGDVARRGSLVAVVAGAPYGSRDERKGAGAILDELLTGVDSAGGGVVLTGPVSAAGKDGLVTAVRSDPTTSDAVSTVDVADRAAGPSITVLALAAEAAGTTGHYGSADAPDGTVPESTSATTQGAGSQ